MLLLPSGGSHKISAHEAARMCHSPACNQLLHYVVPTARAAGFQRKDTHGDQGRQLGPGRRMNTGCSEPERGVRNGRREGPAFSLRLSASGLEKLDPWGFAAEQEALQG